MPWKNGPWLWKLFTPQLLGKFQEVVVGVQILSLVSRMLSGQASEISTVGGESVVGCCRYPVVVVSLHLQTSNNFFRQLICIATRLAPIRYTLDLKEGFEE